MSNYQLFHNDLPSKVLKSFRGDISIDTETLGLNIKRDRLCLIQLRNETNKKVYLIKSNFSKDVKTIGVGDNFNDLEMIKKSDFPCLVKNDNFDHKKVNINNLIISNKPSPMGWADVIKIVMEKIN